MEAKEFYLKEETKRNISDDEIITHYYDNGLIKSCGKCVESKKEGLWKFFREDGSLLETGEFTNSQKDGLWITYDVDGEITSQIMYIEGNKVQ